MKQQKTKTEFKGNYFASNCKPVSNKEEWLNYLFIDLGVSEVSAFCFITGTVMSLKTESA